MKIVKRSPDLGIGIRLQKKSLLDPKPPYWWGWGGRPSDLTVMQDIEKFPSFWPGFWTAVVEDASEVFWHGSYTPARWETSGKQKVTDLLVWTGDPVLFQLPPQGSLPNPEVLFKPQTAKWENGEPLEIPLLVASGNTLAVYLQSVVLGAILSATAFVDGAIVGSANLTFRDVSS